MVVPNSTKKDQVLILIAEKDKIEKQISDFGEILRANNVGMSDSLVDDEGFPMQNVDVYQVRHARQRIICLQNDLKELVKEIEKGLHEVHAEAAAEGQATGNPKTAGLSLSVEEDCRPFIKVNIVFPGSPAEDAGLTVGDEILQFGSINSKNFKSLTSIGEVVRHRENQKIKLKVKRGSQTLEMDLIPKPWSGRGLLGCNIILPDTIER